MKVRAVDEAKHCVARRKAFRWMGFRGMKSRTAEGMYGVFYRRGVQPHDHYKVTLLMAVYEPRTAMWYTNENYHAEIRSLRLDLPEPATQIMWVNASWLLQDVYKRGYPALAEARILGHL